MEHIGLLSAVVAAVTLQLRFLAALYRHMPSCLYSLIALSVSRSHGCKIQYFRQVLTDSCFVSGAGHRAVLSGAEKCQIDRMTAGFDSSLAAMYGSK